jgi:hypothetical protein
MLRRALPIAVSRKPYPSVGSTHTPETVDADANDCAEESATPIKGAMDDTNTSTANALSLIVQRMGSVLHRRRSAECPTHQ